jgi:hypothetical protein
MNKVSFISILFIFLSLQLFGQTKEKRFSALSSPEKWWVVGHPFKAKRALEVTLRTLEITDSIKKTGLIGADMNGGELDAFKHSLWMASMSHYIGQKASLKLGKAHEKGNYRSFIKGGQEDGVLPDKVSSDMDLFNNQAGAQIASDHPKASEDELIQLTIEKLKHGGLKTIKKDGNVFLTCQGVPIPEASLIGNWQNDKCLIPSNKP